MNGAMSFRDGGGWGERGSGLREEEKGGGERGREREEGKIRRKRREREGQRRRGMKAGQIPCSRKFSQVKFCANQVEKYICWVKFLWSKSENFCGEIYTDPVKFFYRVKFSLNVRLKSHSDGVKFSLTEANS